MTVTRTRRRPFERPASEHHKRFNQSINRIEPELQYRPIAESNQGLLGGTPDDHVQKYSQRTAVETIQINTINQSIESGRAFDQADLSPKL